MIYIFDDRAQRRQNNEEKLRTFSDILRFMTINLKPGKSIEEKIIDSIENPECIIFHKSYVFENSDVTFETIRELFAYFNVPIVIFSGGIVDSSKSSVEINMNADLMYEHLPFFLEDFKSNGKINIDTLIWGKRYRLNSLLQFQNKISERYLINNNLENIVDDITEVRRRVLQSANRICPELGNAIIADIDNYAQLFWKDLANIIDKNIQKFKE